MTTANPARHQANATHDDPLVAAAEQKVAEAKRKLRELKSAVMDADEAAEQNAAMLETLRKAAALHEAEVTQRNEELAAARDAAQQKIDRIDAALHSINDEPEPATPDQPAAAPAPAVVDHPAATTVVPAPAPTPAPQADPAPSATRKTFKQRLQDFRSRLA